MELYVVGIAHQTNYVSMFDEDAFWFSCGSGGIDDVGEVLGCEADGGGIDVGWGLVVPVCCGIGKVEYRQCGAEFGEQVKQVLLGEQGDRGGVFDHEAKP